MEAHPDLPELRAISVDLLGAWVSARYPDRVPAQWWRAVFESIETAVSPLRDVDQSQQISDLWLGVEAVTLAVARRDIDVSAGAYWLLRLAAAALRLDLHTDELPNVLTPDGATAWALEKLPLSRDAAVAALRVRKEQYLVADESFFAPTGVSHKAVEYQPDSATLALIDVERILSALPWVKDFVRDPRLRHEVQAWLAIEGRL